MDRKTQKLIVTPKTPNVSFSGEELEKEGDYVNAALCTENNMSATSDKKSPSFTQSFLPIAVCWVILLVIMALRIYFTSVISENNAELTTEHEYLMKQTKKLETQRNNLTEQIQNMKTERSEQNVTRAQWSIDAYCPKENGNRQCKACESGWVQHQSSCYVINNPPPPEQKTWEEAQDNCRGRNSDLAVIVNEDEKRFINDYSFGNSGINGYWIGLRVEDGRWKWINGSNLTKSSWMQQPPPINGNCAIFVHNEGWKSVNCGDKKQWICKKKALSV